MVIVATVHITAGELADDVPGVLAKVRNGLEVIVEQDHHPVAIIRPPSVRQSVCSRSQQKPASWSANSEVNRREVELRFRSMIFLLLRVPSKEVKE